MKPLMLLLNQKGSSLIGALMTMMVLGFSGMAVVEMSTGESNASINDMQATQALYVGQAGIEYAKDQLAQGLSPDVTDKVFGRGTFTIVSSPDQSSFQVTSQVGNARKIQTIGTNFSGNCASIDLTEAYIDGNNLVNARFIKYCNEALVISGITIDWDVGSCEEDADAETECVSGSYGDYSEDNDDDGEEDNNEDGDEDGDDSDQECDNEDEDEDADEGGATLSAEYQQYEDPDHSGKILVCHIPPGNPENAHTLSLSVAGWEHGHSSGTGRRHNLDYLGSCEGYEGDIQNDDDDEGEDNDDNAEEDAEDDAEDDDNSNDCSSYELQIYQCENDLEETRDHGSAHVVSIGLEGALVYDVSTQVGSPSSPGADGAETIDVEDITISNDGEYVFRGPGETPTTHIQFDTALQEDKYYQITVSFADGSQITQSFIAGVADAEEGSENEDAESEEEDDEPAFVVDDGAVVASEEQDVEIEVTGSEIYNGRNEISVQVELGVVAADGTVTYSQLYSWQDVDGGEAYTTVTGTVGTTYILRATATRNGSTLSTYASTNETQVLTLVNGDAAPDLPSNSASFASFMDPYISSDNIIELDSNKVMMLFELDADIAQNPSHPNIDFDDLVVILSFTSYQSGNTLNSTNGDVYYKQVGDQLHYLEKKGKKSK